MALDYSRQDRGHCRPALARISIERPPMLRVSNRVYTCITKSAAMSAQRRQTELDRRPRSEHRRHPARCAAIHSRRSAEPLMVCRHGNTSKVIEKRSKALWEASLRISVWTSWYYHLLAKGMSAGTVCPVRLVIIQVRRVSQIGPVLR